MTTMTMSTKKRATDHVRVYLSTRKRLKVEAAKKGLTIPSLNRPACMTSNWIRFLALLKAQAEPVYAKYAKLRAEKLKWQQRPGYHKGL